MITVNLSIGELDFIKDTIDLVKEEIEGIEEDMTCDYILTTGAKEQMEELEELINAWYRRAHNKDI